MSKLSLEDHVVVLTGGTSGIGRRAARVFARTGGTVAVVGRNRASGEAIADELTAETAGVVRFHRTDLADQTAVRALADEILETYDRLDVLAHNAGLSSRHRRVTADGIERTLAVNHLAPYLLTHELIDRLRVSAPSRIVVTTSGIHRRASLDVSDLQFEEEDYDALEAYARSKLANVAFTIELATRLEDVTVNCFHPGFVPSTGLFRDAAPWTRAAMRIMAAVPGLGTTPEEGARQLVRLATAPKFGEHSGLYVGSSGVEDPDPAALDPELRERLWTASADLVGVDPDW